MKKYIMILLCVMAFMPMFAQQRDVRGTVRDANGDPVIGATVRVVGNAQRATVTDMDGVFTIKASPKEKLNISYVGCKDAVVVAGNKINVTLVEDSDILDEVVVVGYGTQKKATLTGAVSAISNKEMTVTKNENTVNMLAGKVSGVRITQASASPGDFASVIDIRGMGAPLIVVDGIPRDQAYFSRMDASEIENISVLKDASASIYGVRAANGVIVVTTKHGTSSESGKFDINFSANYGWQSFLYLPETASATDHMLLMNEKINYAFGNNTYPKRLGIGTYSWDKILEYSSKENPGTNWTDELFDKTSPMEQYNISVNGSSQKIDYFFNLGYQEQMGSYKSHSLNYNRWNFRSNVDARITDRFKATVALSGYMDEKNQPFTDIWAVYKKAWTYRPTAIAYVNGDHNYPAYDSGEFQESENPVAATNSDYTGFRQEKRYNFNGALTLQYDFKYIKGLSAKAFYSYDYYTTNNTEYKKTYQLYNVADKNQPIDAEGNLQTFLRNPDSYVQRSTDPNYATDMQLSLSYNHKFGKHSVGALLLFEEQYNTWDNFYAKRVMSLNSPYLFAGDATDQVGNSYGLGDITRKAWIGRVNYDYAGKYIAEFSFREDASSKWADGSRWGFFPSVLIGYRISEESWMKKLVPFLTNLKIRASYGEMGDDGSGSTYPPTSVGYNLTNGYAWYYDANISTGVSPTAIPNPDLTWYKSKIYNIGVDWDLWNGKFGGTVQVFKRKRSGLLDTASRVIPGTVGASLPQENMNSDETFGWEIELSHRNRVNGINYFVTGQISAAKNRWDHVTNNAGSNSWDNWHNTFWTGRNKDIWWNVEEGGRFESYEQIQNHPTVGDVGSGTLPGDYYYEDWNHDGVIDGADSHPMASYGMPVFNYGISLGGDWKGIDISMNWQGAAGVYATYDEVFAEVCPFSGGAALDIYTDRWHTANVNDDPWNPNTQWVKGLYPATGHSFNSWGTGIRNTSYLRLKTLEIGYSLPKKWLRTVGIKDLRIYVNGYNLLTFTPLDNIDPERPGSSGGGASGGVAFYNYPVTRTYNIGANIKF